MDKGNRYELSWKAVLDSYGIKDVMADSLWPALIALLLIVLTICKASVNLQNLIKQMCDTIVGILPDLISILIGAFAIWISFFLTKTFKDLVDDEDGLAVLHGMNASFLVEICLLLFTLLLALIVGVVSNLEIKISFIPADIVNTIALYTLYFVCINSIWMLKDIAKNLHNVARFAILRNMNSNSNY